MSKLVDERRRDTLKHWALEECYRPKAPGVTLDDMGSLYRWIVDFINPDIVSLTYLEFGVAHGDSIRFFSEQFKSENARFIGFDSFEGLPEPWLHMPRFFFNRGGRPPENRDNRVSFVKGWFQNSVAPFLEQTSKPSGTVIVHYDADLYGSTLFVITQMWTYLREYYFIMDDFQQDDSVALFDFASAYPVDVEFIAQAGKDGNGKLVPLKVFGRIRNRTFAPEVGDGG